MKVIIEIDEDLYEDAKNDSTTSLEELDAVHAIKHGTELITCKDCIWYHNEFVWNCEEIHVCGAIFPQPLCKADSFCSRARRKDKQEGAQE